MIDPINTSRASETATPLCSSLLLAAGSGIFLAFARNDLAQHDNSVAVHECNPRETLAILERIAHERLLWLKAALGHLIRLERVADPPFSCHRSLFPSSI